MVKKMPSCFGFMMHVHPGLVFTHSFNLHSVLFDKWQFSSFLRRAPSTHFHQCTILLPTKAFLFSNILSLEEITSPSTDLSKLNSHTQLCMFLQGLPQISRGISLFLYLSLVSCHRTNLPLINLSVVPM